MGRKTALITGAGRGIGSAIAIALSKRGYDVGINYRRSREQAEETCRAAAENGAKAVCIQGSVASTEDRKRIFDEFFNAFGTIDLLVNNAGISKFAPFLEVTEEQWEKVTFTDYKGAFFCTQLAARKMVEQKKPGLIINISSNHVDGCWPDATVYGATKAALTKFGKNAAMELARYGIRVITVAPGYTDVGWPKGDGIFNAAHKIPLGRFAAPEEVGKLVAYLASDEAAYMTGNCITIDGGALLPILPENYLYDYDAPSEEWR